MSNSISAKSNTNPAKRPAPHPLAALRAPSARDIEIYKRVKILNIPQNSVTC
jgi:hypothetical protein